MSRIGKKPVELDKGVTINVGDTHIGVKGPKGNLQVLRHKLIDVKQDGQQVVFTRPSDSRESRAAHGLMRALTQNAVTGVTKGWERKLEINGVGYRAEVKGKQLVMQLGYSHPIEFDLPTGVEASVEKNIIVLKGIDREALGAAAAKVRSFRPPEPYKGKGIRYQGEHIQRKVGKAAG
jgi:large subunit ribosomal protein L6